MPTQTCMHILTHKNRQIDSSPIFLQSGIEKLIDWIWIFVVKLISNVYFLDISYWKPSFDCFFVQKMIVNTHVLETEGDELACMKVISKGLFFSLVIRFN